jgi:hypothetical protein
VPRTADPRSVSGAPRSWRRSEISGNSRRPSRGAGVPAFRPTTRFRKAETPASSVPRAVDLFMHRYLHSGIPGRHDGPPDSPAERNRSMLLLIIVLVLLFGGGGGYYGYSQWGAGGGLGIFGTVLLVALVMYMFGGLRSHG